MVDGRDSVHTAHAPKPAGEVLRRGQGRVQTPPLSGEETTVPDLLLSPRPVTLMPVQLTVTGQAGEVTIHVPLLVEAGPSRGLARAQTPPLNMAELTVPVPLPVPSPVTPILAQLTGCGPHGDPGGRVR